MTTEERYIARILISNRLLKANGDGFQQLFWAVMRAKHGQEFVTVRPQGSLGDGGNYGYLPAEGHYFQVYGPIDPSDKITVATSKLAKDFDKLIQSWEQTSSIQRYSFVFNDKYQGTFAAIAQSLADIEKNHPTITCRPLTTGNLEDIFLSLPASEMINVVGMLPDPSRIVSIDYGVLRDVISHIMDSPTSSVATRWGDLPELEEKILLNDLCSRWGDLVRAGARQSGRVDDYFRKNSRFHKQQLRDHLVGVYQLARDAWRDNPAKPQGIEPADFVFHRFREELLPAASTHSVETAVDVLIGYYFEACDVFDPHSDKESPSASP